MPDNLSLGQKVLIVKVSEDKRVYLSNGDVLFYNGYKKCWSISSSSSKYVYELGESCRTFTEAAGSYETCTANTLTGEMDVAGVERILSSPGLSWIHLEKQEDYE
jgi:hypothetical protein